MLHELWMPPPSVFAVFYSIVAVIESEQAIKIKKGLHLLCQSEDIKFAANAALHLIEIN